MDDGGKAKMKHREKFLPTTFIILLFSAMLLSPGVAWANYAGDALNAYRSVLEDNDVICSYVDPATGQTVKKRVEMETFSLVDINQDGISEMLTRRDSYGTIFFFSYDGQRASCKLFATPYQGCACTFDRENHFIHVPVSMSVSNEADGYVSMNGNAFAFLIFRKDGYSDPNRWHYYMGEQELPDEGEYETQKANYTSGGTSEELLFVVNDASNRNMVLETVDEITPAYFPDQNFRNFIFANYDSNHNGVLTETECNAVTEIIADNVGAGSVEGIDVFPNLVTFMCDGNGLDQIDVSGNPKLQVLTFNHNNVSWIDLSNNPMLAELYCRDNYLTELDLSANPRLGFLDCRDNMLSSLDVSNNDELVMLKTDLSNSEITGLQ